MLPHELHESFRQACADAGLEDQTEDLLAHARRCTHFFEAPDADAPIGASRIGGDPDLPDTLDWPPALTDDGETTGHAEFIAQFDLAQLPPNPDLPLPRTGHLWVFSRNMFKQWAVVVLHHAGPEPLRRRPRPSPVLPGYSRFRDLRPTPLRFRPGISLPFSTKAFRKQFEVDKTHSDDDPLRDLHVNLTDDDTYAGQLGGYSFQDDIDVYRQFAFAELGKADYFQSDSWHSVQALEDYANNPPPNFTPEAKREWRDDYLPSRPKVQWIQDHDAEIATAAATWQLLVMFRPGDHSGLDFGSGLYFDIFLKKSALAAGDFSHPIPELPMLL